MSEFNRLHWLTFSAATHDFKGLQCDWLTALTVNRSPGRTYIRSETASGMINALSQRMKTNALFLDQDEERELLRRAQNDDPVAIEQLLNAFRPLILRHVDSSRTWLDVHRGHPVCEDLKSVGREAFLKAVERFDLETGNRLASLADTWVKGACWRRAKSEAKHIFAANNSVDVEDIADVDALDDRGFEQEVVNALTEKERNILTFLHDTENQEASLARLADEYGVSETRILKDAAIALGKVEKTGAGKPPVAAQYPLSRTHQTSRPNALYRHDFALDTALGAILAGVSPGKCDLDIGDMVRASIYGPQIAELMEAEYLAEQQNGNELRKFERNRQLVEFSKLMLAVWPHDDFKKDGLIKVAYALLTAPDEVALELPESVHRMVHRVRENLNPIPGFGTVRGWYQSMSLDEALEPDPVPWARVGKTALG